jgi:hypothetical protein
MPWRGNSDWAGIIRGNLRKKSGAQCALCGKKVVHKNEGSIDHIVPRSKGGTNNPQNLQYAHQACNRRKGNTMPEDKKPELVKEYTLSPQETALLCGDLSKLTEQQRAELVMRVCDSVGLNPLTRPFQYIEVRGQNNVAKLILYATKDCTEQLRKMHDISLTIPSREQVGDAYVVTAQAKMPSGRVDESTGAVSTKSLGGDNLCNALMKAETKAKRRVTLSICGLGILDESEIETIAGARVLQPTALPAAVTALQLGIVAPTATNREKGDVAVLRCLEDCMLLGKQLGKLRMAVNNDLQKFGGNAAALHIEYEKALAEKNPRGPASTASAPTQPSPAVAQKVAESSCSDNAPAVDGEAGNYNNGAYDGDDLVNELPAEKKSDAPESEKLAAVMKLMTHAGFEREYPALADKMKVCSEITGRTIAAYSALEPADCAKVLEFLKSTEQPVGDLMASESEITQLQIELKDAKFVEFLKTSKAYKAATEGGSNQAESLRAARLAFAGHVLGHTVETFKDCTSEEIKKLFSKFKELKAR